MAVAVAEVVAAAEPEPAASVGGTPMGMYMQLRRCSAAKMAALRAAPDRIGDFVAPEDDAAAPEGEVISLDKAWHAIHFLLCDNAGMAPPPQGSLFAGEEMGEDFGYGSSRLLTPPEVQAFAGYLSSKPDDFVAQTIDREALQAANVYPDIWDHDDPEEVEEDIDYVAQYFRALKTFVRAAADAGDAVFILIA